MKISSETIQKRTGKALEEWAGIINESGLGDAPHKDIASYLYENFDLDGWWSQEITVLFEQSANRRILGQTAGNDFQLGVSKIFNCNARSVWNLISSPMGMQYILGEKKRLNDIRDVSGLSKTGIEYQVTTLLSGSHFRMKWKKAGWNNYSILQIRVTPKSGNKAVLTVHQEKLADSDVRNNLKTCWTGMMHELEKLIGNY